MEGEETMWFLWTLACWTQAANKTGRYYAYLPAGPFGPRSPRPLTMQEILNRLLQ